MQGCGNPDSMKEAGTSQNNSRLIGTWQQTAIGKEKVSGIVVKLIFTEQTLTMDAPGCLIIADYTNTDDTFTYTIKTIQGERCDQTQRTDHSERIHYQRIDSRLLLKPLSLGAAIQSEYKRM